MTQTIKKIGLLLLLAIGQIAFGQTKKEKALEKGNQAIQLEDEEKYDDALALLQEAQKLDPEDYNYPYEIGLVYYLQKKYEKSLDVFKKVVLYKNITDQCFQMLGNVYDMMGDSANAITSYDEGLKMFPKSGKLYLEKGNIYWNKKEYGKALPFYEDGIEVDPKFSSNYYRAARIYCSSSEEVWGMIYGEIFMNLERNSKRTSEISKLLYDTYKSEIKFTSDSTMTISFCQRMTMNVDKLSDPKNITIPFCMIYEPTLLIAVAFEKKIDINSLNQIRKGFVESYFQKDFNKTYPNILFDYQNELLRSGNIEAYNYWILKKGDEVTFTTWQYANKDKWDNFIKWFTSNPIQIDDKHKFYSGQYQ